VLQSAPRLAENAMAMRLCCVILASSLFSLAALTQAGELYQWKDAKGVSHYSDAPPPKGQYQARNIQVRDGQKPPVVDTKVTTTASANCTLAKTNLERLKAGGNIGLDANGDGKPDAPLNAEEHARQTQLAETNIRKFCTAQASAPAP
jgi:hypothetical protein